MNRFAHITQKLFNEPLALHPRKAEIVMAALADRFNIGSVTINQMAPQASVMSDDWGFDDAAHSDTPYDLKQGVGIVSIEGTLVQKLGSMRPYSGMCGYDGIRSCFCEAMKDPEVKAIALHIDSPGGEVAGCFDLVDLITAARGTKPIWAILDECAFSAAYAIASAADHITIPRTGGAGSIGVIAMLVDLSQALQKAGLKVNIIQFGARKADGNQFQALPKEARDRFQAQIDMLGGLFVETVASNRSLDASDIIDMEAATFMAGDALAQGLVDAVMSPAEAFADLVSRIS